ncbi:hypothetical protein BD324DRAFT_608628 [Kockovaella imperatae]|uniref:BZIP domain-containing protein n=1 Tax=Kockovaella imperatae TaxID=4999 RepID=A0A1Y1UIL6_9TREE|nr:hypothetical protein BD324DRAFT_608628 [Kockovaella imperatae]ORX37336.1 hypothetical protein BD324DRAFT_608628 [Kockovaella imperatae]
MVNGPQRVAAKPLAVIKDTSSSAGKVFAKPSKEWVIPERTKPGRKISEDEPDNKRQSQNRLSQRAHRARKTDYISTLEEKLRQYEADEIHSNVRLQEVARALKADNERLKVENGEMRAEVEELKRLNKELKAQAAEKRGEMKLWKTDSALTPPLARSPAAASSSATRLGRTSRTNSQASPGDVPARRETIACPICPDPDPDCPCQKPSAIGSTSSAPLAALSMAAKVVEGHEQAQYPHETRIDNPGHCGVCRTDAECLCRVLDDNRQDNEVQIVENSIEGVERHNDACGLCTSASFCACKVETSPQTLPNETLSHHRPAQHSSVVIRTSTQAVSLPLKKNKAGHGIKAKIWDFVPSPMASGLSTSDDGFASRATAECSGDPSNCEVCKDDSFGQEFCAQLYADPTITKPCDDCPGNCMSISALLCSDGGEGSSESSMTADQAWKTLKAHPNSRFAPLALLADVVAKHTTCVGHEAGPSFSGQSISSTAPSQMASRDFGSSPTFGLSRGSRRRLKVETSGVRDALRMLDEVMPSNQGDEPEGFNVKRRKLSNGS